MYPSNLSQNPSRDSDRDDESLKAGTLGLPPIRDRQHFQTEWKAEFLVLSQLKTFGWYLEDENGNAPLPEPTRDTIRKLMNQIGAETDLSTRDDLRHELKREEAAQKEVSKAKVTLYKCTKHQSTKIKLQNMLAKGETLNEMWKQVVMHYEKEDAKQ